MGTYYSWINIDKKEYITPYDFGCGNKFRETMTCKNELLRALHALLHTDWKGCRIGWIGDECRIPGEHDLSFFDVLREDSKNCGDDARIMEVVKKNYKNVSGSFKGSEKVVREEIKRYLDLTEHGYDEIDEYHIAGKSDPFEGMFTRDGMDFEYIINRTEKVCYSFSKTELMNQDDEDTDPLPILMGYGEGTGYEPGAWLGDIIDVSDEIDEETKVLDYMNQYIK